MSFMKVMKTKRKKELEEDVLHEGYEGQKEDRARGKCPS